MCKFSYSDIKIRCSICSNLPIKSQICSNIAILFFPFHITNSLKFPLFFAYCQFPCFSVCIVDTLVFQVSKISKVLFFLWSLYFHSGQVGAISWNFEKTKSVLGGCFNERYSGSLFCVNNNIFQYTQNPGISGNPLTECLDQKKSTNLSLVDFLYFLLYICW